MTSHLITFAAGIGGGAVLAVYWPKIQIWLSGETVRVEDKIKDKL
jgi:uncharacterized membrane protein (UPF0182 family)